MKAVESLVGKGFTGRKAWRIGGYWVFPVPSALLPEIAWSKERQRIEKRMGSGENSERKAER